MCLCGWGDESPPQPEPLCCVSGGEGEVWMSMWGEERVYVGGEGCVGGGVWGCLCGGRGVCIYVEGGEMSPSQFWPQTSLCSPYIKGFWPWGGPRTWWRLGELRQRLRLATPGLQQGARLGGPTLGAAEPQAARVHLQHVGTDVVQLQAGQCPATGHAHQPVPPRVIVHETLCPEPVLQGLLQPPLQPPGTQPPAAPSPPGG